MPYAGMGIKFPFHAIEKRPASGRQSCTATLARLRSAIGTGFAFGPLGFLRGCGLAPHLPLRILGRRRRLPRSLAHRARRRMLFAAAWGNARGGGLGAGAGSGAGARVLIRGVARPGVCGAGADEEYCRAAYQQEMPCRHGRSSCWNGRKLRRRIIGSYCSLWRLQAGGANPVPENRRVGTALRAGNCASYITRHGKERLMLSGFIFDVEGTLVDSVPQNLRSLQDALERFGHRVPYQTLHLYSGLDGDQTLQLVVPDAAEPERKEILEVQGTIYEKSYLDSVRPFDGVRGVFRALTERGGRIALATDCKGLAFKRYLALLDVNELITGTACGDDVEHGKPDPRLVGHALGKLKIPAPEAVMIGDTPYDAEAW